MRKLLVLSALATLGVAGPVMAGTFSYDMVEAGIIGDTIDDPHGSEDLEGHGLSVGGSVSLTPNVFGFANYSSTDYEYRHFDDSDFTVGHFALGVGFDVPLSRRLDLVSGISLQRLHLDNDNDTLNEDGYGLNVGLRGMLGPRLQWTVGLNYVDYGRSDGDDGDDTSWTAGFRYYFTRVFAVGVDVGSTDKNQANALIAFRWDLGNR
ncbi:MAG: outer membrane beta-barrel protein [Pseudomonadota bacterium]